MRLGIKAKQVAGVTILVGLSVILLSAWYLSEVARVHLQESSDRAELAAKTIFIRAFDAIAAGAEPQVALQSDPGLQSILRASLTTRNIEYASIVDTGNVIVADGNPERVGLTRQPAVQLQTLLESGRLTQLRVIADRDGRTYEFTDRLALQRIDGGTQEFATIRVGVSTLLIRGQLEESLRTPLLTVLVALIAATLVAMLLAQVVLRPIHVIRSGLARLGRGELDVNVDLSQESELADLGDSFKAVSARLAADQSELAGQKATLESVVEHLEEAVALFAPDGALLFANPAMRATLQAGDSSSLAQLLAENHPYRRAVEETFRTRKPQGPRHVSAPGAGDRLILTHIIAGPSAVEGPGLSAVEGWLGVMLVARNLAYLSEVESTLSYSRKLAALGRLSAGIAHEVKNPLNATMIHLELLKMQVHDTPALEHVQVIAAQVRRLDEVVQGFLKFTRPADPDLRPTALDSLIRDLLPIINAEASKSGVEIRVEVPASLPDVSADAVMLQQAFLNLALNACQAMPHGGRLRIAAVPRPHRRVEIVFEDTGQGIPPDNLGKIFDLYFTTKDQGTGIGLSMVYRTVQLHDGDIEVQSVAGKGTTFRVTLRQA